MKDESIIKFINKELSQYNFKKCTKGYKYLFESILLCIKDDEMLEDLNNKVFPIIAKKYKAKTALNVKWCIEQSIKSMYLNTDDKIIKKNLDLEDNTKPTIKFLIYSIVSKFQWQNL